MGLLLPRRSVFATAFLLALPLDACASGPGGGSERASATLGPGFRPQMFQGRVDDPNHEATISAPLESVWLSIADAFEALDLPIGYVDEARHAVGVEGVLLSEIGGQEPSALVDCGRGPTASPLADVYAVTMAYEVLLDAAPSGGTRVDIDVVSFAQPRADAGHPVRCTSLRVLERMIVERLSEVAARIRG